MTRFLIIGDLHGVMPKVYFSAKSFDAIIAPGDLCSDKGMRKIENQMMKVYIKNPNAPTDFWDIIGKKKAKKIILDSLDAGNKILRYLETFNKPVFVIPGNWDWAGTQKEEWKFLQQNLWKKYVLKGLKHTYDMHSKIRSYGSITFLGYGICNGPELLKYRHYENVPKKRYVRNALRYKRLVTKYNQIFLRAKKRNKPIIFLSHNMPFNTAFDVIHNKDSPLNKKHYGSNLARTMIDKHHPMLCIGGHMHEYFGTVKVGRTSVIDAGFGGKVNTLLEITDKKILLEFYDGKKRKNKKFIL